MKDLVPFGNRLGKNDKHLSKWARKQNIEAYRVYDRDIPEYPFIVDRYGDHGLVYQRGDGAFVEPNITAIVAEVLGVDLKKVVFKAREQQKGLNQYEKLADSARSFTIKEGNCQFWVNLVDYLDTGLFLDHRPTRLELAEQKLEGKSMLNLFCYTGSVSVAAAKAGAKCTNVDLSNTYLNWGKDNFRLNKQTIDYHHFIRSDVKTYLMELQKGRTFDLIFLDPPTFSNSKSTDDIFDVRRDHGEMIRLAMDHLSKTGKLIFSTNSRKFKLDEAVSRQYQVEDRTKASIPPDFRDQKIHQCYHITHN